jgi:hypothetical protein
MLDCSISGSMIEPDSTYGVSRKLFFEQKGHSQANASGLNNLPDWNSVGKTRARSDGVVNAWTPSLRIPAASSESSSQSSKGTAMKVAPTHSIKQYVHHDNDKCTERNNIEKENLRQGTGGKPLCQRCAELNKEGK